MSAPSNSNLDHDTEAMDVATTLADAFDLKMMAVPRFAPLYTWGGGMGHAITQGIQ